MEFEGKGKVNLGGMGRGLQIALELMQMVARLELETMTAILIGMMMTPFILGSLWSLGFAVIWQLIAFGFKAGIFLFTVCFFYMAYLKCKGVVFDQFGKPAKAREELQPKCTYLDLVLSVFLQTGLRLPPCVWDAMMEIYPKKGVILSRVGQRLEYELSHANDDSDTNTEIAEDEDTGSVDHVDVDNNAFEFVTHPEASSTTETASATKKCARRRNEAQKGKSSDNGWKGRLLFFFFMFLSNSFVRYFFLEKR